LETQCPWQRRFYPVPEAGTSRVSQLNRWIGSVQLPKRNQRGIPTGFSGFASPGESPGNGLLMCRQILTSLALVALLLQTSVSAAALRSKYETKAGYLLNFAEFIEWPAGAFPNAKSSIILGVVGKDPFGAELDKLQGKTVNGRTLEIKRFKGALEFRGEATPGRRQDDLAAKQAKKLAEMKSCHILFITSSEKNFLPQTLKPFRGTSVLTVGETDSFVREGGIITFVDSENSVQLEVNLAAAEQARLKISSKLLSLAKVIKIEREPEKK